MNRTTQCILFIITMPMLMPIYTQFFVLNGISKYFCLICIMDNNILCSLKWKQIKYWIKKKRANYIRTCIICMRYRMIHDTENDQNNNWLRRITNILPIRLMLMHKQFFVFFLICFYCFVRVWDGSGLVEYWPLMAIEEPWEKDTHVAFVCCKDCKMKSFNCFDWLWIRVLRVVGWSPGDASPFIVR